MPLFHIITIIVIVPDNDNIVTNPAGFVKCFLKISNNLMLIPTWKNGNYYWKAYYDDSRSIHWLGDQDWF